MGDNISFVNLKVVIVAELVVDEWRKKLLIRYIIEGNSSLITISNDMSVRLYVEVKKKEPNFGMYPLCVHNVDLNVGELLTFDTMLGLISYAKIQQNEMDVLGLVEFYEADDDVLRAVTDSTHLEIKEKQMYKDKSTLVVLMDKYKIEKGFNFKVNKSDNKWYKI